MSAPVKRPPSADQTALLRRLPSVDELLLHPAVALLGGTIERSFFVAIVREVLTQARREIVAGTISDEAALEQERMEERVVEAVRAELAPSLRPVINATGVILHTNLGRAPLSFAVIEDFRRSATQYSNLEYDLGAGARGKRDVHLTRLITRLTGAESAVVVNNCAAAVLVSLAALARGGEVIVSRGELIEIGDGFRIPEIMEQSGAVLREVGTTNRTRIADFERAITDKTRLLLRVHRSNFEITGFTEQPGLEELVALARARSIPLVEDLGSGALFDLKSAGIQEESGVLDSLRAGVDVVTYSGDKLLGGPQAGMLSGRRELIAGMRSNSLFRALRADKLVYAALEATLLAYVRGDYEAIPALRMMRLSKDAVRTRAEELANQLKRWPQSTIELLDGGSVIGGGAAPSAVLPTCLLGIRDEKLSADELLTQLRRSAPPIIARVENDRVVFDLRTVFPEQDSVIADACGRILSADTHR